MLEYGSVAEWIQAIGTWFLALVAMTAGILAGIDLYTNRKQLKALGESSNIQLFSALLREISGDEASYDRGVIKKHVNPNSEVNTIKDFVEKGRATSQQTRLANLTGHKPKTIKLNSLIGMGIERTISRYDRVGFFLLGEGDKLRMQPPTWLWTHVNIIWLRLYKWIEYRQTCVADTEYYHQDYAKYLHKLANTEEARARQVTNQD